MNELVSLRYQRGQAALEFVLLSGLIVLSLLIPWSGRPAAIVQLHDAWRSWADGLIYWLAVS